MRAPDGTVQADPGGRAAGRGAYVCHDRACIDAAITRGALARALDTAVPAELLEGLAATFTTDMTGGGARGQE